MCGFKCCLGVVLFLGLFIISCSTDSVRELDNFHSQDGGIDDNVDSSDPFGNDGCSEASRKIYLVDRNKTFYSFYPPDEAFVEINKLACEGLGTPYSMSVSRNDVAYILYTSSTDECVGVNAIDVTTGDCIGSSNFECGTGGFRRFGMGFASDSAGSSSETLYIGQSLSPYNLGTLSVQDWSVQTIGTIGAAPEMTGTGNGELWGFFAWNTPPFVSQIDKATGNPISPSYLSQLSSEGAFAFAHWGGDFYLFHAPSSKGTTVWKFSNGTIEKFMETETRIVGAGVSTCAPVVI